MALQAHPRGSCPVRTRRSTCSNAARAPRPSRCHADIVPVGKGPPRFALAEVVYLFAFARLGLHLGVDDRKKIYRLIEVGEMARRGAVRS